MALWNGRYCICCRGGAVNFVVISLHTCFSCLDDTDQIHQVIRISAESLAFMHLNGLYVCNVWYLGLVAVATTANLGTLEHTTGS